MKVMCAQLLGLLLLVSTDPSVRAAEAVLPGVVTRVIDGDTIDVQLQSGVIRVRLNGIDTPERGQPWGSEARKALEALVMAKHVELEPFTQDRYERLVANVLIGAVDVNKTLVSEGHAWAYRKYLKQDNLDLCGVEAEARRAKRGLWALNAPERAAPWDWRKRPRQFVDYSQATETTCIAETSSATRAARPGRNDDRVGR